MAIIALTAEHIDQLKTPAGGYNEKAMAILGCWPLRSGWKERLVGSKIGDRRLKSAIKPRLSARNISTTATHVAVTEKEGPKS